MDRMKEYDGILDSPVGFLGIRFTGTDLTGIEFLGRKMPENMVVTGNKKELLDELGSTLKRYFSNPYDVSQPKTALAGTSFQNRVWKILSDIKPGKTKTYGEIAKQIHSSPRAVGNACRRNPVPIFIPCHRVVAASGRGGFMGHTSGEPMAIKDWLLANEQETSSEQH